MIRYPFLIDQVLITNERNGTSIVLSRDEARRLLLDLEYERAQPKWVDDENNEPSPIRLPRHSR